MNKVMLDQKRLELLRRQLYGKEMVKHPKKEAASLVNTAQVVPLSSPERHPSLPKSDSLSTNIFLKKDLLKILSLSSLAIIAQLLVYFGSRNHLLNLNLHL